jgi:FtsH-binding integral membrane protein
MTELLKKYADQIGISGSFICLLHCTALPLLGILTTSAASGAHGHTHFFIGDDLLFAFIGITAAYFASKNSKQTIIKILFWIFSLGFSFSLIISEIYQSLFWLTYFTHFCAFGLIGTHGYHFIKNRKNMECQLT